MSAAEFIAGLGAIAGLLGGLFYWQKRQAGALLGETKRVENVSTAAAPAATARTAPAISPVVEVKASGPAPLATRGVRNNNPGNIRDTGIPWRGRIGADAQGFLIFDSPVNGLRAIALELKTDFTRDGQDTIFSIINEWAPPTENVTSAYVASVAKRTGFASHQFIPYTRANVRALMRAIVWHENGADPYAASQYDSALDSAGVL